MSEHEDNVSDSEASQKWWNAEDLKMPTTPQSKISTSPLFQELRESVAKETRDFTFACGGTIPIIPILPEVADVDEEQLRPTACLPIDLRWDSNEATIVSSRTKLTFPLEPTIESNLDQLIHDMTPATFGLGEKHVYDESYRKAAQMSPTCFSSTFNPYELGIINAKKPSLKPEAVT